MLTSPQGIALDGENLTNNNDPNTGVQLPLPSGDGYPGGNFYDTFIINTTPPSVTDGNASSSTRRAIPTSSATSSPPRPCPASSARSPSPTRRWCRWPARRRSSTSASPCDANGVYSRPTSTRNIPANLLPYIRAERRHRRSPTPAGNFTVTVGVDAAEHRAGDQHRRRWPTAPYNVGTSGQLVAAARHVSGYYVARARIIDQSGNQSNPTDPNAQANFVVDTATPTVSVTSPANNSVISSSTAPDRVHGSDQREPGPDALHRRPDQADQVGPNGSFTGTATTTIAINPNSIAWSTRTRGPAAQGSGADQLRPRPAPSPTASTSSPWSAPAPTGSATSPATVPTGGEQSWSTFARLRPEQRPRRVRRRLELTSPIRPSRVGDRANPYPTITAALAKAASVGDRLGDSARCLHRERDARALRAAWSRRTSTSTDSELRAGQRPRHDHPRPGDGQRHRQRHHHGEQPAGARQPVDRPRVPDRDRRPDDRLAARRRPGARSDQPEGRSPSLVTNSNILIDKRLHHRRGHRNLRSTPPGPTRAAPQIINNGVIGNINGIDGSGRRRDQLGDPDQRHQQHIAFNTIGLLAINTGATSSEQAYVANNIFWQNHDQTAGPLGHRDLLADPEQAGPATTTCSRATVRATPTPRVRPSNIGNGFDPAKLGPTASDAAANLGNFTGYPAFVSPRDPRPGSDGPATFLLDANFGLTGDLGRHQQRPGEARRPRPTSWATRRTPTRRPRASSCPATALATSAPSSSSLGTGGTTVGRRCLPRGHHLARPRRSRPGQRSDARPSLPPRRSVTVNFSGPSTRPRSPRPTWSSRARTSTRSHRSRRRASPGSTTTRSGST